MKKLHLFILFSAWAISGIHCGQGHAQNRADTSTAKSSTANSSTANPSTITLTIDGKKYTIGEEAVLELNYVGHQHLVLAVMSEKEDLSLSMVCFTQELKAGTYQIYSCIGIPECPDEIVAQKQEVLLAPYPKTPMPPVSTSRNAYQMAKLGLQPLSLVITSVEDAVQQGVPWKTMRVKGHFEGKLAYVEKNDAGDWQIIGKTTQLSGEMDMYCWIR